MSVGRPSPRSTAGVLLALASALALARLLLPRGVPETDPMRGPPSVAPMRVELAPAPGDTGFIVPGVLRITHVDATDEGWTVLEGPSGPVVWVDADGRTGPSLGRRGRGPGELEAARYAARRGARVAVLDMSGSRLDELSAAAEPVRRTLDAEGCVASTAEDLTADAEGWLVLRRCLRPGTAVAQLLRVGTDGSVRVIAVEPLVRDGVTDPFLRAFVVADGSVRLGSTRSDCLPLLAGRGAETVCMSAMEPLPVPADLRRSFEGALAERARAAGIRLFLPEHLPAFTEVRPLREGWAVQRIDAAGSEAWTLELPGRGSVEPVPPGDVRLEPGPAGLLMLKQEPQGLRAWIVPAPRIPLGGSPS